MKTALSNVLFLFAKLIETRQKARFFKNNVQIMSRNVPKNIYCKQYFSDIIIHYFEPEINIIKKI